MFYHIGEINELGYGADKSNHKMLMGATLYRELDDWATRTPLKAIKTSVRVS